MRIGTVFALAVAVGLSSASAETIVTLDFVGATANEQVVFGDEFDDGLLNDPPWIGIVGSPGPETGTTLEMHGGDFIFAPIGQGPLSDPIAGMFLEFTSFPEGSLASLVLFSDTGHALLLSVVPGAAFITDETGTLHGMTPFPDVPAGSFVVALGADDFVWAMVNHEVVIDAPIPFGNLSGIGVLVLPEPTCLLIVGAGLGFVAVRRNRR